MYQEPTNLQLQCAFNNACLDAAMNFPGGNAERLTILRELRNKRHTWFGREDHDLMYLIDDYLREYNA